MVSADPCNDEDERAVRRCRRCTSLKQAVNDTECDVCALDEAIHRLSFITDKVTRQLDPKKALTAAHKARIEEHLSELDTLYANFRNANSVASAKDTLGDIDNTLQHIHDDHVPQKFRRWKPARPPPETATLSENIPWTNVIAVTVDAAVDGLMIGLALSASEQAGLSMAIATTIEMSFLGLSFSATMQNCTRNTWNHAGIVCIPPITLFGAGIAGHFAGAALQSSQGLFIGFIAFAVVALLYLVAMELLVKARRVAGEGKPCTDPVNHIHILNTISTSRAWRLAWALRDRVLDRFFNNALISCRFSTTIF